MNRFLKAAALGAFCMPLMAEIAPANFQQIEPGDSPESILEKAANVVPSARQLAYQQREFSGFIHFGPNTFTGREWGTGKEDPQVFNPTDLDTDQWCDTMARAGMKMVVITVKHHDGFVLWQSRYTQHGVMSSPLEEGNGDILRDLVKSCRAQGLKIGVYLSPADLYQMESPAGLYGNLSSYSERTIPKPVAGRPFADTRTFKVQADDYNEYFMSQLFELLTEYGPIHEVWFDGAHPKKKGGQTYIRDDWYSMIRELAPEAVIFGGPDVRWVGNESGDIRATEWSVIPMQAGAENIDRTAEDLGSRQRLYDKEYKALGEMYQPKRLAYTVAEVDTSIRHGWFFRDDTHQQVRSADDVFDIYERSVGGNGVLLLNIPPNTRGHFSKRDVDSLLEVGARIRETYGSNLLEGARAPAAVLDADDTSFWQTGDDQRSFEMVLGAAQLINRFMLQEAIATHGQRIEEHALDAWVSGQWQQVAQGTTVGYKKILRFPSITTDKLRLRITQSRLQATVMSVSAHYYRERPPPVSITRGGRGKVEIALVKHRFGWKPRKNLLKPAKKPPEMHIHYTTDGSDPTTNSPLYKAPFEYNGGTVKARAFWDESASALSVHTFGITKKHWKVVAVSSAQKGSWYKLGRDSRVASRALDNNPDTLWQTTAGDPLEQFLAIDLGKIQTLSAFVYTPPRGLSPGEGLIISGQLQLSDDGENWRDLEAFEFGNLVNDPSQRTHYFEKSVKTRYIKLVRTEAALGELTVGAAEIGFIP